MADLRGISLRITGPLRSACQGKQMMKLHLSQGLSKQEYTPVVARITLLGEITPKGNEELNSSSVHNVLDCDTIFFSLFLMDFKLHKMPMKCRPCQCMTN